MIEWREDELPVPALEPHQRSAHVLPSRFLLLNCGRRWGKDVFNVHTVVLGRGSGPCTHGPGECQRALTQNRVCWAGLVDGWDVVWIAPDFPQGLTTLWEQEVKPRFANRTGVTINEQKHSVSLRGLGTLHVRSAENIHSVRGLGKRLAGVVTNEAAHLDLETAWRSVIRPALMDRTGWFVASSTPNSGLDGNSERIAPSYFNRLVESVVAGEAGPEWGLVRGDARDNPRIAPAEFEALVRSYPADSPTLREEVFAELLAPGAGLAFPEWEPTLHTIEAFRPLDGDRIVAGMDWGIRAESVIEMAAVDSERSMTFFAEWVWTDKDAYEAGYDWGLALLNSGHRLPEVVLADAAMWQRTGIGGKTVGQEFTDGVVAAMGRWAPPITPAPHGPGSRATKLSLWKRGLSWGPRLDDGRLPPSRRPQIRFVRGACPYAVRTLPRLPYAPKRTDDVDTTASDHAYDAGGNILVAEYGQGKAPDRVIPVDLHPGLTQTGRRRDRTRNAETEAQEALEEMQALGVTVGGRYGVRPPR